MKEELELITCGDQAIVPAEPSPAQMLQAIVKGGITSENMAAVEKALDICYRMEARNAEKEFTKAFVALQADLPVIVAKTIIPNRGKYERFEDVMDAVSTHLAKHGFSVSFSMDFRENRIIETCNLKHVGGHSQSNSFAVRCGKADTDTQADCKAATTAKRNALLNALNIVIRQDCLNGEDDARIEGAPITAEQVKELRRRVAACKANEKAFLDFAGAAHYEAIPASKYSILDELLKKKGA